jgi:hypothetical protein
MNTVPNLTSYRDYEQIMIQLAKERGWEFEFTGESVPLQSVFNHATYAPALLVAAGTELSAREIPCDLAFEIGGEPNSLFGAKVSFPESLPRNGNVIQLDHLQYVLGDEFAHYVSQAQEADQ